MQFCNAWKLLLILQISHDIQYFNISVFHVELGTFLFSFSVTHLDVLVMISLALSSRQWTNCCRVLDVQSTLLVHPYISPLKNHIFVERQYENHQYINPQFGTVRSKSMTVCLYLILKSPKGVNNIRKFPRGYLSM